MEQADFYFAAQTKYCLSGKNLYVFGRRKKFQ
jgi:hypothetical protein